MLGVDAADCRILVYHTMTNLILMEFAESETLVYRRLERWSDHWWFFSDND